MVHCKNGGNEGGAKINFFDGCVINDAMFFLGLLNILKC